MVSDIINLFLPVLCLLFAIFAQTVFSLLKSPKLAFKYKNVNIMTANLVSIIGILAAIVAQMLSPKDYIGFYNSVAMTHSSCYLSVLSLLVGLSTVFLARNLLGDNRQNCYKYHILLLTALIGAMCVLMSNDFLTLFVALETLSFSLYFLIAFAKGYSSKEASFKYLIVNAVSVIFFLFGVSYLLGITSSLNFAEITQVLSNDHNAVIYTVAGIMIFAGLAMKLAIFPFANWVLDVYSGTDTATLNFLSTVPKIAVLGLLFRLLTSVLGYSFELNVVILLLAILSAFWANIYALKECNVKRLMACSSSANAAYMLIVMAIVSQINSAAVLFYLICYTFMNIGVFAYLNSIEPNIKNYDVDKLPKSKGVFSVVAFLVCVIGLAGLPITSGFVAKIYLLYALVESGLLFIPLILLLIILFSIALCYYIKLARSVINKFEEEPLLKTPSVILQIAAVITVLLGILPFDLIVRCVNVFA